MKKSFLLLLISIMTVFLIAGCADDTTKGGSGSTEAPTDPALVEQIKQFTEGYYEITFFYTDGAGIMPISSSCTDAGSKGLNNKQCQDATMKGYGQITVDSNGGINLVTKIQMTSGVIANLSKDSQYNYTVYPRIPASSIDMTDLETKGLVYINKNGGIKGTTGRDLTKNVSDAAATYSFEYSALGTITNTMVTTTPVSAGSPTTNVIVEMKKIDALPGNYTMDKNTMFPAPTINGFVPDPQ